LLYLSVWHGFDQWIFTILQPFGTHNAPIFKFQHYRTIHPLLSYWWFNQFSGLFLGTVLCSLVLIVGGATCIKFGEEMRCSQRTF